MAGPLMHMVEIDADPKKIYEALSTANGLASFWTADSHAEPKVGSIARFGFHGPVLEMKVSYRRRDCNARRWRLGTRTCQRCRN